MSWNLVRLADVQPSPWKNGGGTTRELLAWPSPSDWRVRISVADVTQDGPFSRFDGIQRWFAVLEGEGVWLDVDGRQHELTPASEPLEFDGGAQTGCRLVGGATRDLNLMARDAPARMQRVKGSIHSEPDAMTLVAAYVQAARATATFSNETAEIPPFTLAWRILEAKAPVHLAGEGVLWMEAIL